VPRLLIKAEYQAPSKPGADARAHKLGAVVDLRDDVRPRGLLETLPDFVWLEVPTALIQAFPGIALPGVLPAGDPRIAALFTDPDELADAMRFGVVRNKSLWSFDVDAMPELVKDELARNQRVLVSGGGNGHRWNDLRRWLRDNDGAAPPAWGPPARNLADGTQPWTTHTTPRQTETALFRQWGRTRAAINRIDGVAHDIMAPALAMRKGRDRALAAHKMPRHTESACVAALAKAEADIAQHKLARKAERDALVAQLATEEAPLVTERATLAAAGYQQAPWAPSKTFDYDELGAPLLWQSGRLDRAATTAR